MKSAILGSTVLFMMSLTAWGADEEDIRWLVTYDGSSLPGATWNAVGKVNAKLEDGALHLVDDGAEFGNYRASWKAEPGQEIVVEAKVKVGGMTGAIKNKATTSLWPWRDGAPVMVQVSDGRHQEGLVLFPAQATSFTDRFIPMETTKEFHRYRLVIRGTDMSMDVDGQRKVEGQNAFWKPADSPEPFIRFGSTAKTATGDALWQSVRLGIRKMDDAPKPTPVKCISETACNQFYYLSFLKPRCQFFGTCPLDGSVRFGPRQIPRRFSIPRTAKKIPDLVVRVGNAKSMGHRNSFKIKAPKELERGHPTASPRVPELNLRRHFE